MIQGDVWADVVGQEAAVRLLRSSVPEPVHAYLLVGPHGSGKRALARAFAAALLCQVAEGGCADCRDCRLTLLGEHPDVREVERVGPAISAEQADEVVRLAALAPVEGRRKVLILDEFHLLRPEAAAKLLKTIEEPTATTVFVICADDFPHELVTIASRCVRVELGPVATKAIEQALLRDGLSEPVARDTAAAANGDLRRARLLATDPGFAHRREVFGRLGKRLDGTGTTVAALVDELETLLDAAAGPLKARQEEEIEAVNERAERYGERGSGRKALEDRHKRELRRHRTDELRAGLAVLAGTYRDGLTAGTAHDQRAAVRAVTRIHEAIEALGRNPNEVLLLQALLLELPPA